MKKSNPKIWVIIPAAGVGSRMGAERPKQYLNVMGRPLLAHTLDALAAHPRLSTIVVALNPNDRFWSDINLEYSEKLMTVVGGSHRLHSVLSGLRELRNRADDEDWVLVHDAVRPCISLALLDRLFHEICDRDHPVGGLLGWPVSSTLKKVKAGGEVSQTVPRDGLWQAQTPQLFRFGQLNQALHAQLNAANLATDEAYAIEQLGLKPQMVLGSASNIKVTYVEDLTLVEAWLGAHKKTMQRVGFGYDCHAFTTGDHVMIGGVKIPFERGVQAHSDGDVVLHALGDALLGAAALGDLGHFFPDTDPKYKDVASDVLLTEIMAQLNNRHYAVQNVDITVIAQAPRIAPHISAMRTTIASLLHVDSSAVSVKATTNERMGWVGRKEGLAAQAVALISQKC